MRKTISILFFVSGSTGLVYQVLWAKYLSLFFGNTAQAHTIVLAVFLGGLALGSLILGKRADSTTNPLKLYAILELGIGLLGLLSPAFLYNCSNLYIEIARSSILNPALLFCVKLITISVILLVPTILMGGTLPALCRFISSSLNDLEKSVSWLYFLNSAGAALGALLAGFFLIPAFGLDLSTSFVALVNILIGIAAFLLAKELKGAAESPLCSDLPDDNAIYSPRIIHITYIAIFLSGFASLAYEIAWIRLLSLVLGSSAYSFSLMLSAFIAGIALGALLINYRICPKLDSFFLFGLAELGICIAILLTLPLYERLPYYFLHLKDILNNTPNAYTIYLSLKFLFCFVLMLLPTTLLGMTLPLATRAVTQHSNEIGEKVGKVYAANTIGNVLGAIFAGLLLLPLLGIKLLIEMGTVLNLGLGLLIVLSSFRYRLHYRLACSLSCLFIALIYWIMIGAWDNRLISSGAFLKSIAIEHMTYEEYKQGFANQKLRYYKDDSNATVNVTQFKSGNLVLKVNGKADASTGRDISTQVLLAQIPAILHGKPKDVLVVGLGSGITAGSALTHDLQNLDVVEISSAVVEAARFFNAHNTNVLEDKRTSLHLEDAKTFLKLNQNKYDLIISEPSNPWIAGIGNLFSVEFYEDTKAHLKPNGIMVQWFHSYSMNDDLVKLIIRTFCSSFPHVTLWNTLKNSELDGDFLLLGSTQALSLDYSHIERLLKNKAIAKDLARININSLPTLLSLQVASNKGLRSFTGQGSLNEDLFPILEYQAPKALFMGKGARVLKTNDVRIKPRTDSKSYFIRYLEERQKALTNNEYQKLASYHKFFSDQHFYEALLKSWLTHYPNDLEAVSALINHYKESGQVKLAIQKTQELLEKHPNNKQISSFAKALEQAESSLRGLELH